MRLPSRLACHLVIALFPAFALAAPCSGFTDVDSANAFCPNVDWLKNRGVTLGCTTTTYCPDAPVTRLQMAAFMNRLGAAFTPLILYEKGTGNGVFNAGNAYICQTADVPVSDFRRFATGIASVTYYGDPSNRSLRSRAVLSSDGGATWQSFDASVPADDWADTYIDQSNTAPTVTSLTRDAAIFGASYRFAVEVNVGSGVAPPVLSYRCQLRVSITNRNGANVPY